MSSDMQNLSTALEGVAAGVAASLVSVLSHRMQASGFVGAPSPRTGPCREGEVSVVLPGGETRSPDRWARCEQRHRLARDRTRSQPRHHGGNRT